MMVAICWRAPLCFSTKYPIVRDISREKKDQTQLLKEMELLASVLDGSPIPTFMINHQGEVILWNRACELISCISRQDVLGKPPDLKPLFEGKAVSVLAEMLLRMPEKEILEVYGRRGVKLYKPSSEAIECIGHIIVNGGKRKTLRIIAARVRDFSGRMMGVLQCAEDITEEDDLHRQLFHSQKMEALGRLTGEVAHDFNNALCVITGYADSIMMELGCDNPICRKIEKIKRAGEQASSLTRRLLAFSRRQMSHPVVLNLNPIIRDLEQVLRHIIGEGINFTTVLDPDLERVRVDPVQVEQIITNLVINARDALPGEGRIILETANVEFDHAHAFHPAGIRPGGYVMLAVRDTGAGMSSDTLSHVFEPFFTTKEEGRGTGLGLSSVYGIVQQYEGHIQVQSELGKGSIFRIYLPRFEGNSMG
ncbi:MAG: hypothetical protein A2496_18045 [Burkholderiales bacterium RIFOXYC12_FULL_60_6]|nr:MAG: hypothetical protein A2496_18045 [Burkholderiales bacterium RIFOXYC12_FULL_60_6]